MVSTSHSFGIAIAATLFAMAFMAVMEIILLQGFGIAYASKEMLLAMVIPQLLVCIFTYAACRHLSFSDMEKGYLSPKIWDMPEKSFIWINAPFFILLVAGALTLIAVGVWATSHGQTHLFIQLALLTFGIGFFEEFIFRGVIVKALSHNHQRFVTWLVSSFLFAIFHFANLAGGVPLADALSQVQSSFLGGLLFGAMVIFARAPLMLVIIAHMLYDFSLMCLLLFPDMIDTLPTPIIAIGIKGAMLISGSIACGYLYISRKNL